MHLKVIRSQENEEAGYLHFRLPLLIPAVPPYVTVLLLLLPYPLLTFASQQRTYSKSPYYHTLSLLLHPSSKHTSTAHQAVPKNHLLHFCHGPSPFCVQLGMKRQHEENWSLKLIFKGCNDTLNFRSKKLICAKITKKA